MCMSAYLDCVVVRKTTSFMVYLEFSNTIDPLFLSLSDFSI